MLGFFEEEVFEPSGPGFTVELTTPTQQAPRWVEG